MNKKYLYIGLGFLVVAIGLVFLTQNKLSLVGKNSYISTNITDLPEAQPTQTVVLKNGDTYNLTASYVKKSINGTKHRMLAYNGSIPGPLIKVAQGAEVTINFKNDTDVKTLLHSHGVRMDNSFDGSQVTQEEMEPGETFAYKLKFPDAGMYWYHPHVREDFQQELGLYGNFLVTPTDNGYWNQVNREIPLFVDDVLIEDDRIKLNKDSADHILMGRFGNVMLLNGETDYSLSVKKDEVIRLYITNAADTRPFKFAIEGTKIKVVGADGGAYESDQWADNVMVGPSERAVVEVLFDKSGTLAIQNVTPNKTYTLGTIKVDSESIGVSYAATFGQLRTHTQAAQSIDPFRKYFDKTPDKQLRLALDMGNSMMNMQGMNHNTSMNPAQNGIEWEDENQMMNSMSNTNSTKWKIIDQATDKTNMDIDWVLSKDQPAKIRIFNDPNSMHPMQHPIHFHGQRFLVLTRNNVKQDNLVWKDTVFIPSGETVDILLDTSNPGTWMAHCHIAEHLESGMMMKFKIQ